MTWTKLAGTCDKRDCPTIYLTEHGTIAVQGPLADRPGTVHVPPDEAIVEIPLNLLTEAVHEAG